MKTLLDDLAEKNGLSEEKYVQDVRLAAKVLYPDKADELAILRKEIHYLREVLTAHGITLGETEFTVYDRNIESAKDEIKAKREES